MVIKPVKDNIVIEVENKQGKEDKTSSGIIIPKQVSKDKPDIGIVIAVGEGRMLNNGTLISMAVKEGQEIIFNRYAGTEVQSEDDKLYLIIKENDVLAIIE